MLALLAAVTHVVKLSPVLVALLAGTVIPILTGIVTKLGAAKGLKAIVAVFLSVIVGFVAQATVNSAGFDWQAAAITSAAAFVANVASYLGVWQPITGQPPGTNATAGFGLGSTSAPPTP